MLRSAAGPRQKRELALDHAAETISDDIYFERLARLRTEISALGDASHPGVSAEPAVEWLRTLAATWSAANIAEGKADLLHAIYERIVVAGRDIVSVRLTPAGYAHGLALALPEKVVMARPTGVGRAITTYRIPIEGRDEWVAAAEVRSVRDINTPTQPGPTPRQAEILAAYVVVGGSVPLAAEVTRIRPSTAKRHLADLRAKFGLSTERFIYRGRAGGWLRVPSLEPS